MSDHFLFSNCYSAYFYLLVVAALFHLCLSYQKFNDDVLCIDGEREALLEFKHGLIDEANRLASWDDGEERDCCRWVGIDCDNITRHVYSIHLRAHNDHCHSYESEALKQRLSGNISSSLLHLKQLVHLDLSCNNFVGLKIPKFIGSLGKLRYLNLSRSNFHGMIPPQLGNLSDVQVLCLGSFQSYARETSMMHMHWLSNLHLLQHLDLSGMDLSKNVGDWLQVINNIPSLVQLRMSFCQLSYINIHVASLNLTSLRVFDISSNSFNSFVPPWIFSMTSLVTLDLSGCNFNGPIPSSIHTFSNLTSLESLNVAANNFMNSSLVLRDLSSVGSNLILLDISSCGIPSSVLDSLHNLTSLISIYLSGNQLTKRIPISLGYNLCNLRDLDLSTNLLTNITVDNLLENFYKCKSSHLELFSVWFSGVYGHLSDQIGQMINLVHLDLSDNNIGGSIPFSIGRLSSLRTLLLSRNLISGQIPYSIGRLSSLEMLDISHSRLSGSLPDSIGELSSLKVLYISNNTLNGSLPCTLGQLSKLEKLSLSYNQMTGVVTEAHFSKLANLNFLDVGGNNLTLKPQLANWIPPFQLQYLYLNSWSLGPQFPLWIQSQSGLSQLDISNTQISSPLPESFWRSLPNLSYLDVSQNRIQGTLSLSLIPALFYVLDLSSNEFSGDLTLISNISLPDTLNLSNNSFSGSLYDLLCSSGGKRTIALNLGNNHLSGIIPECWENWTSLEFLELNNNNFSGAIPTTLGFPSFLGLLNMRGNKLSGKIPASLMNLTKLVILQLGGNELVGSIPSWFGSKLSSLRILNLRSNKFYGSIPKELCYLTHIQILDLAHNNLLGNIPNCFNNFSVLSGKETVLDDQFTILQATTIGTDSLEIKSSKEAIGSDSLVIKGREDTYKTILPLVMLLDLSRNNLVGHIPSELTALKALRSLNLSRNQLTGMIPEKIGDMNLLESLDLSLNKLSGELPESLSNLNFLSSFNVSYNSLTGRVPSSTQLQSFSEWCFFNNKLCGDPLTEPCAVESHDREDQKEEVDSHGTDWGVIISIVLGFFSGLWITLAPLIVSGSWRIAYFHFLSELGYKIYYVMQKYSFNIFSK